MTHVKINGRPFASTFNSFVDDLFTELPVFVNKDFNDSERKGFVPVNVKETKNGYQLDVVAPGFEKTDFKLNVEQNILTISADRKEEVKEDSAADRNLKQIRKEYEFRSFKRSFTLDEDIDATNIEATYVNGVLTLNLPKVEPVKEPKKEILIK
jgi:HSP20 family protein